MSEPSVWSSQSGRGLKQEEGSESTDIAPSLLLTQAFHIDWSAFASWDLGSLTFAERMESCAKIRRDLGF